MHINAGFSNESQLKSLTDFLYEKSGHGAVFTGLMEAISNEVTIITAIHNINANPWSNSAGVDHNKMDKYLQMSKPEVVELVRFVKPNKNGNGRMVAKPYPDDIKLVEKIRNLRPAIRKIKDCRALNCRVAQIEYVNSVIMGISEYIKSSISSHAFNIIDYRVNNMVFAVWKRMYPKNYLQMKVELQQLSNLPARHEGHEAKTFLITTKGNGSVSPMRF